MKLHCGQGRFEEAEELLISSYKRMEQYDRAAPATLKDALQRMVDLCLAWGQPQEADRWRALR